MKQKPVCPWCGSLPKRYDWFEDDGHVSKRFGCPTRTCPVKPFIDLTGIEEKDAEERWGKQRVVKELRESFINEW